MWRHQWLAESDWTLSLSGSIGILSMLHSTAFLDSEIHKHGMREASRVNPARWKVTQCWGWCLCIRNQIADCLDHSTIFLLSPELPLQNIKSSRCPASFCQLSRAMQWHFSYWWVTCVAHYSHRVLKLESSHFLPPLCFLRVIVFRAFCAGFLAQSMAVP